MRVPEAYLLLDPFEATRPGLLVLDADGRRVAAVALTGEPKPADVAAFLVKAKDAPATEGFELDVAPDAQAAVAKRLEGQDGIESVRTAGSGRVFVRSKAGTWTSSTVLARANGGKKRAEVSNPVAVAAAPASPGVDVRAALSKMPGVWQVEPGPPVRAWVTRWLLHPSALGRVEIDADVVSERYLFDDLPKGASAVALLRLPEGKPGVLAVIPDVFHDAIEVVGRKRVFEAATLRPVFESAGQKPKPAAR